MGKPVDKETTLWLWTHTSFTFSYDFRSRRTVTTGALVQHGLIAGQEGR